MRPSSVLLTAAALLSSLSVVLAQSLPAHDSAATPAVPAAPALLTLTEALSRAATRNFSVSAARREVEASVGAAAQAGARRNPQFSALVEDTQRRTRVTTGTFDIPFELGGKRAARVAAAERSSEVARSEVARVTAELRATVVSAFDKVLIAQERIGLSGDSAEIAARSADATARRVAAGKVSPVEETRARVDQANAQLELEDARAELRNARYGLSALWNEAEPSFTAVQGEVDSAALGQSPVELVAEIATAPALVTKRLLIEQRRALVEVERSKRAPDINLSVGVRRDNDIGRTQAVVGFSVPLPLFDRNDGAISEADRRVAQAQDQYDDARVRLTAEVQQALLQLDSSRRTVQTLKSTVLPAAQQLYDAANKGFAAGKFGFLDVLDAQRTLLQTRSRYLASLASARQASATLDRLLGR